LAAHFSPRLSLSRSLRALDDCEIEITKAKIESGSRGQPLLAVTIAAIRNMPRSVEESKNLRAAAAVLGQLNRGSEDEAEAEEPTNLNNNNSKNTKDLGDHSAQQQDSGDERGEKRAADADADAGSKNGASSQQNTTSTPVAAATSTGPASKKQRIMSGGASSATSSSSDKSKSSPPANSPGASVAGNDESNDMDVEQANHGAGEDQQQEELDGNEDASSAPVVAAAAAVPGPGTAAAAASNMTSTVHGREEGGKFTSDEVSEPRTSSATATHSFGASDEVGNPGDQQEQQNHQQEHPLQQGSRHLAFSSSIIGNSNSSSSSSNGGSSNNSAVDEIETLLTARPGQNLVVKVKRNPPESLGLSEHIELYNAISEELWTNIRQERDWNQLYEKLKRKFTWMTKAFASVSLFKQRCKLLMEERRKRQHVATWKNMKAAATGPAITVILEKRLKTQNIPEVSNDYSMLGDYFAQRIQRSDRSPGSILDWPNGPRTAIVSKLMALHKYHGYGSFYQVHEHVDQLVQACEVELAILSTCDCEGCSEWKLAEYRGTTQAYDLRLRWTRKRAQLMHDVLTLHQEHSDFDMKEFAALVREKMPLFKNWREKDIASFLHGSHSSRSCIACSPGSKPKRPYRNRKIVALQAAEEHHAVAETNYRVAERSNSPSAIKEARQKLQIAKELAEDAMKAVTPVLERSVADGSDPATALAAAAAAAAVNSGFSSLLVSKLAASPRFSFMNALSPSMLLGSPSAAMAAAKLAAADHQQQIMAQVSAARSDDVNANAPESSGAEGDGEIDQAASSHQLAKTNVSKDLGQPHEQVQDEENVSKSINNNDGDVDVDRAGDQQVEDASPAAISPTDQHAAHQQESDLGDEPSMPPAEEVTNQHQQQGEESKEDQQEHEQSEEGTADSITAIPAGTDHHNDDNDAEMKDVEAVDDDALAASSPSKK